MAELESRMSEMKSQMDAMQTEYNKLHAEDTKDPQVCGQQPHNEPQIAGPIYAPGVRIPQGSRPAPLNSRIPEDCPANEAINRYVQQSPTEEPCPHLFMPRTKGSKRGVTDRNIRRGSGQDATSSMLSPPETVASPPGEQTAVGGPRMQQNRGASIPSVPYPSTAPRQHIPAPPVRATNANSGTRNANGPPEKTVKCLHPGCKSKFARESELRYVATPK
jgi:hypothetical protein